MSPTEVSVLVERSRVAQGLPPKVDDPTALAFIASLLRPPAKRAAA